ncbi:MAG: fructosamine kinase family protein [Bacteroidota bacterium]
MNEVLAQKLAPYLGYITSIVPVGGGCIANASRIETALGPYFLKWGNGEVVLTFEPEAAGLAVLAAADTALRIPQVVASSGTNPGFLLMEWIVQGAKSPGFDVSFGEALAALHRQSASSYGFTIDNFIGRTPQQNTWHTEWPAFFQACRLAPQVALARKNRLWQPAWDGPLESLYKKLPNLLPKAPPASLLHGDLWGGNYMVSDAGAPVLFDPACYYGDRETDLAMTTLFGGFSNTFYDAYAAAWPMEAGFMERRPVYNLYHQINHLNLFGGGYAGGISAVLRSYA